MRQDEASYGRQPANGRASGEDPLAELARLIGQEDPFAEFFRENEPQQQAPRNPVRAAPPAPSRPEPVRQEPVRQEPARHEPVRQEAPRPVAARPAAPVEPLRPEQRRPEPYRSQPEAPRPGAFSALAAEVYNEPVPRVRTDHHEIEDAARALSRDLSGDTPVPATRVARPGERSLVERAPVERPPVERPSLERAPIERQPASRSTTDAVAAALGQGFEASAARSAPAPRRPEPVPAPAPQATYQRSNVPPAPLFDPEADEPPMPRAVRGEPQARGYDLDDDTYDYGRTASEHDDEQFEDDYEYEDERPARGRSRLMLIAAASLGVLVLGAGGYFGWRAVSGGSSSTGSSSQPPVIRADQGPNKVTPAPTASTDQSADGQKLIYDRVGGDPSGNEQVVSSEEQPVDPSQVAQPQAQQPRVILPQSGGTAYPTQSPSQARPTQSSPLGTLPTNGNAAPPPANPTEPKRVRTLTVRADGTVVDGPAAAPPPPVVAPAGPAPGSAQSTLSAYANGDANTGNVPLPGAGMPQNAPLPPSRVAAAPAAPAAQDAPAATASTGGSGYFVQVAAQRSQGEAQTAWRDAQRKYPGILGSYSANIRRADLGDRGIYFRAQVGPFDSRDQANDLCQSLRAQGGDCMVQRN